MVAFSGGEDSLVLLALAPKDRTHALYVNHNIRSREELSKEIENNKKNARALGYELEVAEISEGEVERKAREEGIGTEAAARMLRYEILLSRDADYVLTAHHQDDLVESFLMKIEDKSPFYRHNSIRKANGRIYRPLLYTPKSLIHRLALTLSLTPSIDSTNFDLGYRRNWIRHYVLPLLTEREKDLISKISGNVDEYERKLGRIDYKLSSCFSFSRTGYLSSPKAKRERLIFECFSSLGVKGRISKAHLDAFNSAVEKGVKLDGNLIHLRIAKDEVRAYGKIPRFVLPVDGDLDFLSFRLTLSDYGDEKDLVIDFDLLSKPWLLRLSRDGDRIHLKEGWKNVRDLEKEYKVPYSFVLEDRNGLVAILSRALGGRDRLSRRFLGKGGKYVKVTHFEHSPSEELH